MRMLRLTLYTTSYTYIPTTTPAPRNLADTLAARSLQYDIEHLDLSRRPHGVDDDKALRTLAGFLFGTKEDASSSDTIGVVVMFTRTAAAAGRHENITICTICTSAVLDK